MEKQEARYVALPDKARRKFSLRSLALKWLPILEWLPEYDWRSCAVPDLAGGLTLGCILVAQSLAHADLCKVALINGPYSCMLPPILYAIFGTCVHSSVGTGGLVSLLAGEQLAGYGDLAERTHAGAILTLEVGLILILMGLFQLSFLVRFLSRPALSGFITASAILIILSQIPKMLGLPPEAAKGGFLSTLLLRPENLLEAHTPTLVLSVLVFLYLYNAKKLKGLHRSLKFLGDFKELVALAATAVFCSRYAESLGIDVVGKVPSGLPSFSLPLQPRRFHEDLAIAHKLLPGAFLVALVVFLSSFAGAKKFAMKDGYKVTAFNELLALGVANAGGAFNGAVPTQIGLSRMGIAHGAGVKSQLGANIFVALVVAGVVQVFSSYLFFVPRCVLNCIIVNGASHLTEFDQMTFLLRVLRESNRFQEDMVVWAVACLSTIAFGAFNGILTAVAVSLLLILQQIVNPNIVSLAWKEDTGTWVNARNHPQAQHKPGILIFRFEGPIFYANIERFQEWLEEEEVENAEHGNDINAIVLSASSVPFVDMSAIQAMKSMLEAYKKRGVVFVVANAIGQPGRVFQQLLAEFLPEESLRAYFNVDAAVELIERKERGREDLRPLKRSLIMPKAPLA